MYKKNILAIHLNSQIFKGFSAILFILTALIFSSRLVGYFEQAAAGILNPDIIFSIMLLRLPDFLALLIPFAVKCVTPQLIRSIILQFFALMDINESLIKNLEKKYQ